MRISRDLARKIVQDIWEDIWEDILGRAKIKHAFGNCPDDAIWRFWNRTTKERIQRDWEDSIVATLLSSVEQEEDDEDDNHSFNQFGARSDRISSSTPNLQNIPRACACVKCGSLVEYEVLQGMRIVRADAGGFYYSAKCPACGEGYRIPK